MIRERLRDDRGTITLPLTVLALALLVSVGLVVDGGAKIRAVQLATRVAAEAARAGAQEVNVGVVQTGGQITIDPHRARLAAQALLADAGVSGTVSATPTSVAVTASSTRPTVFLGMLGIGSVTGTGSAQAGLTIEEG